MSWLWILIDLLLLLAFYLALKIGFAKIRLLIIVYRVMWPILTLHAIMWMLILPSSRHILTLHVIIWTIMGVYAWRYPMKR